ncbi:MAG: PD-(D/E)XK nuclease family protein [Bacillota bacterium]
MDLKNNNLDVNKNLDKLEIIINNIKKVSSSNEYTIKNKIRKIKESYIKNWEEENKSILKKITNQINIDSGIPLPVLSICGKGTREIRFTEYLSYFLNPKNSHGINDRLLKSIFSQEAKKNNLRSDWYKEVEVFSEFNLGFIEKNNIKIYSYADIVIIADEFVIIIEHKILSNESSHPNTDLKQLERYNHILKKSKKLKDKKQIKIYLTPDVSDNVNDEWNSMTHQELVNKGLELINSNKLSVIARENLIRLLMDLAIGPYEKVESTLTDLFHLANNLQSKGFKLNKALKFENLLEENELIIDLLTIKKGE